MSEEYTKRITALLEQVDWATRDFVEQYLTKKAAILNPDLQEVSQHSTNASYFVAV